jgi:hypothetical protein
MSRHETVLEDGRELAIGWDGPEASFYAQVFDPPPNDEVPVINIGAGIVVSEDGRGYVEDRVYHLQQLASRLAEHGLELTSEQLAQLRQDKVDRGSELTPLQRRMKDFFDETHDIERLPRDEA